MIKLVLTVLAIFVLIVGLLILYWRRVVDNSLTAHFRAAESISAGYLPAQWARQIERSLRFPGWRFLMPARSRKSGTALALAKLDKLSRFFGRSRFFEDEETKQILLGRLDATRQRWQEMTWDQLSKTVPP